MVQSEIKLGIVNFIECLNCKINIQIVKFLFHSAENLIMPIYLLHKVNLLQYKEILVNIKDAGPRISL